MCELLLNHKSRWVRKAATPEPWSIRLPGWDLSSENCTTLLCRLGDTEREYLWIVFLMGDQMFLTDDEASEF